MVFFIIVIVYHGSAQGTRCRVLCVPDKLRIFTTDHTNHTDEEDKFAKEKSAWSVRSVVFSLLVYTAELWAIIPG